MARVGIWMPIYIGDYLSDTMRLTTEQHGAYFLLLLEHWKSGALPDDDDELAAITRLTLEQWLKHRPKLERYFTIKGGTWKQNRVEKELASAKARREAASKAGKKGAKASNSRRNPTRNQAPTGTPMGAPVGEPMGTPMGAPMGAPVGTPMGAPIGVVSVQPGITSSPSPSPSQIKPCSSRVDRGTEVGGVGTWP